MAAIVPGSFFGEMSLLTGEPRLATLSAASDCIAYEITKDAMSALLSERPELAETLGAIVAARKLRNSAALADASTEEQEHTSVARAIVEKMRSFFRGVLS